MLLWRVPKKNSGFTLIEMLVAVIIIGVLAGASVPNILGLLNRNRINTSISELESGLRQAQKQAVRLGKRCEIDVNDDGLSNAGVDGVDGCLLSTIVLHDLVELNSNRDTIVISAKGNIIINDANNPKPILVANIPNLSKEQRCVVIESRLGAMRTGDYDEDKDPASLSVGDDVSDDCQ